MPGAPSSVLAPSSDFDKEFSFLFVCKLLAKDGPDFFTPRLGLRTRFRKDQKQSQNKQLKESGQGNTVQEYSTHLLLVKFQLSFVCRQSAVV